MNANTVQKALKCKRLRPLKNFLWVLFGIFLGIALVVGAVFIVLKAVPVKTFTGNNNEIVSEELSKKSLLDVVFSIDKLKLGDLPIVENTLKEVFGGELEDYVQFDYQTFNSYGFTNIGGAFNESLTISVDTVKLVKVLPYDGNQKVYSILCDATGISNPQQITVANLDGMNVNKIKLTSVIEDTPENEKVYNVLRSATGKHSNDQITVEDFNENFDTEDIVLSTVFSYEGNLSTYKILCDAVGVTNDEEGAKSITINDLNAFNSDNIKLTTVLPYGTNTQKLYNILLDSTGKSQVDAVLVGDLNNFNVLNIKLSHVLTPSDVADNALLSSLVNDRNVTLGDIDVSINQLKLSDIYAVKGFVADPKMSLDPSVKYVKRIEAGVETFTLVDSSYDGEVYYISKHANIWFFVLYQAQGTLDLEGKGYNTKYSVTDMTYGDFEDDGMESVTSRLNSSTIRQLWATGVLNDANYGSVWTISLNDALALIP